MGNPRRANGHRDTQLRLRVLAAYTHCALCGEIVDKSLPPLDPGAPERDHIIPVALGGAMYTFGNSQLAHRICNQRKGAQLHLPSKRSTTPPPPAATTRDW